MDVLFFGERELRIEFDNLACNDIAKKEDNNRKQNANSEPAPTWARNGINFAP